MAEEVPKEKPPLEGEDPKPKYPEWPKEKAPV